MSAAAVVVGVDDYAEQPLTSAVRDALAFRDALVALGLVQPAEITLLTSPVTEGSLRADRQNIDDALRAIYDNGAGLDHLFVFFAGHGLIAPVYAARGALHTAFVPVDVRDLRSGGYLLFDVDDLCARLSLAGPREQFLFVDACRDLAFGENPGNMNPLSWPASPNPSGSANAQAILYAVSPMGTARSVREGMGVMTTHLIEALRGTGRALDWSEKDDCYVVTATSVAEYVRARLLEAIQDEPHWQQLLMLPELRPTGPPPSPVRLFPDPPRRTLTLSFDPTDAATATMVKLRLRGNVLEQPCWPPHRHGEAVEMRPETYRIQATSERGPATADPMKVDVRERDAATIRIGPVVPSALLEPAPGAAAVEDLGVFRDAGGALGPAVLRAYADEPETVIEIDGLDPPYRSWRHVARCEQDMPPGSYRVRFRLGNDVFSETEVDLVAGENKLVKPTTTASPLLLEALGEPTAPTGIEVSESIGPMQAAALPTTLAIVGIKAFDETKELFGRFDMLVRPLHAALFGDRPVSVVVAVEGNKWSSPVREVVASLRAQIVTGTGQTDVPLAALEQGETGWARIAYGVVAAPGTSFGVWLLSPHFGRVELAAGSLAGRVTVIAATIRPDGVLDVAQHLMRIPGRQYDEPVPSIAYGRLLRELALGERLYQSGELVERGAFADTGPLRELLHAKWTDPVLGCMAYYAWTNAIAAGLPEAASEPWVAPQTASNLLRYFRELPDARVIAAAAFPPERDALIDGLLTEDAVPLVARSCRELAGAAQQRGAPGAAAVRWAARVPLTQSWTLRWEPDVSA